MQNIVVWNKRLCQSAGEIATKYGLLSAGVYATLAYYCDRRENIDL